MWLCLWDLSGYQLSTVNGRLGVLYSHSGGCGPQMPGDDLQGVVGCNNPDATQVAPPTLNNFVREGEGIQLYVTLFISVQLWELHTVSFMTSIFFRCNLSVHEISWGITTAVHCQPGGHGPLVGCQHGPRARVLLGI